jgi:predicted RNase H-like HicB family nuclease
MAQTIEGFDLQHDRFASNDLQIVKEYKLEAFGSSTFECRVVLSPEQCGYSAHALDLPGVVSEGDSLEEALENVADAFREAILSYRDEQKDIPWKRVQVDRLDGSKERWIIVNV